MLCYIDVCVQMYMDVCVCVCVCVCELWVYTFIYVPAATDVFMVLKRFTDALPQMLFLIDDKAVVGCAAPGESLLFYSKCGPPSPHN